MPLPERWVFDAIGTAWHIDTRSKVVEEHRLKIRSRIESFEKYYSRFRADSLIMSVAEGGSVTFPKDSLFKELFQFYTQLNDNTGGAINPLVGTTLQSMGYDESYSLKTKKVIPQIDKMKECVNWDGEFSISLDKPGILDFGAAGKGLLVDIVAKELRAYGYSEFVVDASGDMAHCGVHTYKIGLEDPEDSTKAIGVIDLKNESLCGSSINRRSWGNGLHHVVDALTNKPTNDIVATWVLHPDSTMKADGLATALFFVNDINDFDESQVGYLRIKRDGTMDMNELMNERVKLFVT